MESINMVLLQYNHPLTDQKMDSGVEKGLTGAAYGGAEQSVGAQ